MKKGFTLIEILAVVVLLAVITLITTPMIYAYIQNSKEEAFSAGVLNVFDSVSVYITSNEDLKEISVTDESLNLKNSTYESGVIFVNSEGILEAENISDGIYCASGVKGDLKVSLANSTELPCSDLDSTPPTLDLKLNSRTSSSVTILAVGEDRQSGILGYSYSLNQTTWSAISTSPIITISGLNKSQELTVYVKVYNINYDMKNADLTTKVEAITVSTLAVDEIDFEINTNESNTVKTLTIIYPLGSYSYSYSINNGEYITTTNRETDLIIKENQKITARITYGAGLTSEKSISIEGIDSVGPVAHIEYSSTWQVSKTIAVIIDEETSGLQSKTYSFDGGKTWQISNTRVYANNETLTNKIKVRDKLGNITSSFKICVDSICGNETDQIVIGYIDKEAPTCTLKVTNQTIGTGGWYFATPLNIGFDTLTDVSNYCINGTSCTKKYPGSGIKTSVIDKPSITTSTNGTVVTGTVVDNLGNIGTCTLSVKVDAAVPTITAKAATNYIQSGVSSLLTSYFNTSFGPAGGTTTCYVNGVARTNTNQLALGINVVTCTATANNGKTASASTTFRHSYTATPACSGGRTLSGGNCVYSYVNDASKCGCAAYNSCATSACGVASYNTCSTAACGAKTCVNAACGCATYSCTLYRSCASFDCGYTTGSTACTENRPSNTSTTTFACNYSAGNWCCTARYAKTCRTSACGTETVSGSACDNASSRYCSAYNSCATAACGYNSCSNSACGVASYNTCSTGACGCRTGGSCTLVENQYATYACPTAGTNTTNGTVITATATGSVCNF